jgi:hypothetical protein
MEDTQRVREWEKPPLTFAHSAVQAYWKGGVERNCRVSLERLRRICLERGTDYQKTVRLLMD